MPYGIILDRAGDGEGCIRQAIRGKVFYLNRNGEPMFLYIDQDRRWHQESDPALEEVHGEYPETDEFSRAKRNIGYELGVCVWNPEQAIEDQTHTFIPDLSDVNYYLDMIERDFNIKLDHEETLSDMDKLEDYNRRVLNAESNLRRGLKAIGGN